MREVVEWNGARFRRNFSGGWQVQSLLHLGWLTLNGAAAVSRAVICELERLYPQRIITLDGWDYVHDPQDRCWRKSGDKVLDEALASALDRIWALENPDDQVPYEN